MLNKIEVFIRKCVSICFALVIIYLFLLNLFTITFISTDEAVFITSKNPILYIIVWAIFAAICVFIPKHIKSEIILKYKLIVKCFLCIVIFLESIVWIFAGNIRPVADQEILINAARQICSNDFSAFSIGSYMYMYPHQIGLVLFECLLHTVFGEKMFIIAFQVVSAICIVWIWISLSKIAEYKSSGENSLTGIIVLACGIFMLPVNLYCSFVYGTVIGFAFAVAAIKYEIIGIDNSDIKKLIVSALLMAASVFFKSNYSFIMLAMTAYAIYRLLSRKHKKSVMYICIFVLSMLILNKVQGIASSSYIEHKTGIALDNPVSYLSIIEMGLQDGTGGPGWYNKYSVFTYQDADNSQAGQNEIVKAALKETLKNMSVQKKDAINFFARKIASEWTNPTYEAFWISLRASGNGDRAEWVRSLVYPTNVRILELVFSYFWIVIFGGVLISVCIVNDSNSDILIKLIFLAGFFGLMLWEAKPQYTVMYTAFLIPFSIDGYAALQKMTVSKFGIKDLKNNGLIWQTAAAFGVIVIVLFLMVISPYVKSYVSISKDNERWVSYMDFYTKENDCVIPNGRYTISPYSCKDNVLSADGEALILTDNKDDVWNIGNENYTAYLQCEKTGTYIGAYPDGGGGYNVEASVRYDMEGQDWRFIPVEGMDNCYNIYSSNGFYLSYDSENERIIMSDNNESDAQIWEIAGFKECADGQ